MKHFARLPKTDFAATYSNGKVLRHPLLQLRVLRRNDGSESVNVAFAVGKKLGKATVRNTMRRKMRAAFYEESRAASTRAEQIPIESISDTNFSSQENSQFGRLPLEKLRGANLIFLASPPALEADFPALCHAIVELTKRAASR